MKVCRGCLTTDHKLCSLSDNELEKFFHQLTHITTDRWPTQFCFECLQNLKKGKQFRDKCLRTKDALNQLLDNAGTTEASILPTIRSKYNLTSQLGIFDTGTNTIMISYDTEMKSEIEDIAEKKVSSKPNETKFDGNDLVMIKEHSESDKDNMPANAISSSNCIKIEVEVKQEYDEDTGVGLNEFEYQLKSEEETFLPIEEMSVKSEQDGFNYSFDVSEGVNIEEAQNTKKEDDNKITQNQLEILSLKDISRNRKQGSNSSKELARHNSNVTNGDKRKLPSKDTLPCQRLKCTSVRQYECNLCHYKTMVKNYFTRHFKIHTGEKPFQCDFCGYKSGAKYDLIKHIRTHTGEKPFRCKLCPYKAVQKSTLKRHFASHTGEKPFTCTFCPYQAAVKGDLNKHIITHSDGNWFKCDSCSYKTRKKCNLARHSKIHTGEKPYQCNFCSHSSACKRALIAHINTHTGERPYVCNLCPFKTSYSGSLTIHARTHSGVKPYTCTICPYKATRKNTLIRHSRTHTREKTFGCNTCSYSAKSKTELLIHTETHTGETPCD